MEKPNKLTNFYPIKLPESAVSLHSHWPHYQYTVEQNGTRCSCMWFNGSKNAVPQLHPVTLTWTFCVELPVQRLFLRNAEDLGLIVFGGDSTDAYVHYPVPNKTYLAIDDSYADYYKET